MLRFFVALLLTALLAFAGALFFPWYIIAIAAFITALAIPQPPFSAFVSAFLALFLLWGTQAFLIDAQNNHLLATKIALLFQVSSYNILILITALVAGLVAGMSALTGSLLRPIKSRQTKEDLAIPV